MSVPSRRARRKKPEDVSSQPDRSKAEERMIKLMTAKGGKGFRVLRSAEKGLKKYDRKVLVPANSGR